MNIRVLAAVLALGCAPVSIAGVSHVAPAQAETPAPYLLIRALQEVQNQIAAGKASAREEQPRLINQIGRQFIEAPAEVWREPRNARAAALLTLSGGSPRVLRQIARGGAFAASELSLARGALAFAEGRAAQARDMLLPIDARNVDPSLGGQLALVQAALVLAEDREKAIELLGIARLLAPGTLVEETALRRQISLVGETADAEKFASLARQYARRFKQSLYAEEFRTTFANSLVKIGANPNVDHANSLEPVLATFDRDERCRLAIIIARTTLLQGAMQAAVSFSELVMRPPIDPGCDVVRARLYRAAAKASDPNADADLMALEKLDPSRLSRADAVLHQAALKMARTIRTWPEPQAPEGGLDASRDSAATVLANAERLMASTEGLLVRKRR